MIKTKVAQQLWFISQILVEFLCWGLLLGRTPLCCWGGCLGCRQRCRRPPCTTCWLGPCGGTPPTSWSSPPCLCGRDCCASPWRLSASWLSYQPAQHYNQEIWPCATFDLHSRDFLLEGQKLVSPTINICFSTPSPSFDFDRLFESLGKLSFFCFLFLDFIFTINSNLVNLKPAAVRIAPFDGAKV